MLSCQDIVCQFSLYLLFLLLWHIFSSSGSLSNFLYPISVEKEKEEEESLNGGGFPASGFSNPRHG